MLKQEFQVHLVGLGMDGDGLGGGSQADFVEVGL